MSKRVRGLLIGFVTMVLMGISTVSNVFAAAGDTSEKTILLDRAHMDTLKDVGARYGKYTEKDIVNSITDLVGEKLQARGYNIIYTRDRNTPTTIQQRQQKAWNNEYDYYISLHANSSSSGKGAGTESYYRGKAKELSESICKSISKNFSIPYRKTIETSYYNRKIQDSTIIELGFINNSRDLDILLNKQEEISNIIVESIENQYSNKEETVKIPMGDGTYIKSNYNIRLKK